MAQRASRPDRERDNLASASSDAKLGNLGRWRAVAESVNEMKIDEGPGYRAYFVRRGRNIVVVLCGGDKSTQKKDSETAKQIADKFED